MNKVTLILIDNHSLNKVALYHVIKKEEDIEIIGKPETLGEAINIVSKRSPDIVITDTLFKYTTGLELIQLLKAYSPKTRYIILTSYLDEQHIRELLEAGTSAYVAQDDIAESLVPAIRSAMEGKIYLSPSVQKYYSGPFEP